MIDDIAKKYINSPEPLTVTAGTKRSRKALMNVYERLREKYLFEKKALEHIVEEAKALQKLYNKHKAKLEKVFASMEAVRAKIYKMDEDGVDTIEIDKKMEEEEAGEDQE